MSNVTITVDDEALRRARIRALEQGTSVNALVREFIDAYASVQTEQEQAARRVLELARRSSAGSGGERWSRDALHERR
ncbi:MAG TPA: hypothetical protein VFL93_08610 [Longimicrobiaceae bacterium]|jgi:plasmid stability protein|nr:hypothetical protein [Longimicrobiaceae bacterium]